MVKLSNSYPSEKTFYRINVYATVYNFEIKHRNRALVGKNCKDKVENLELMNLVIVS